MIERNPIPDGPSIPKLFQVTFFSGEPDAGARRRSCSSRTSATSGSRSSAARPTPGTPDGIQKSKLARELGKGLRGDGTARNWNTVTKLLALADGAWLSDVNAAVGAGARGVSREQPTGLAPIDGAARRPRHPYPAPFDRAPSTTAPTRRPAPRPATRSGARRPRCRTRRGGHVPRQVQRGEQRERAAHRHHQLARRPPRRPRQQEREPEVERADVGDEVLAVGGQRRGPVAARRPGSRRRTSAGRASPRRPGRPPRPRARRAAPRQRQLPPVAPARLVGRRAEAREGHRGGRGGRLLPDGEQAAVHEHAGLVLRAVPRLAAELGRARGRARRPARQVQRAALARRRGARARSAAAGRT